MAFWFCSQRFWISLFFLIIFYKLNMIHRTLQACMDKAKKPFSTSEVKQLMIQFLSAVDHMHNKWYIHRDLKTTNLLYQNGILCVCDYGLARKYGRFENKFLFHFFFFLNSSGHLIRTQY